MVAIVVGGVAVVVADIVVAVDVMVVGIEVVVVGVVAVDVVSVAVVVVGVVVALVVVAVVVGLVVVVVREVGITSTCALRHHGVVARAAVFAQTGVGGLFAVVTCDMLCLHVTWAMLTCTPVRR